jgi:hypothetical protein
VKKGNAKLLEASPQKSLLAELEALRLTFRAICRNYAQQVESEIAGISEAVLATLDQSAPAGSLHDRAPESPAAGMVRRDLAHDMRDMLTLLRILAISPESKRRKDLKKIESVLADLRDLANRLQPPR